MRKGESVGLVSDDFRLSDCILHMAGRKGGRATYLIRSNTVIRLPTGESRQVPSGVKRMFPLQ